MVMLMVEIVVVLMIVMILKLRHLVNFNDFYTPFPHPSQSHSTLYNHQSTHLPAPVLFLPVSVRLMAILLLFPSTLGESKCSYTLSEMAEFYDLEKSGIFGFVNRFFLGG